MTIEKNTLLKKAALKKKQKKESLLNTAFELFLTKGLAKTTISDIVEKAGVAKGTFYLYFKDKYDICDSLVSSKAGAIFLNAHRSLANTDIHEFEDQILYILDHVLNQLNEDKALLRFIEKNLSWGIFRKALDSTLPDEDYNIYELYEEMLKKSSKSYKNPELMLFTLVELISSTGYSCILYNEPVSMEEYKPILYRTVRSIMNSFCEG